MKPLRAALFFYEVLRIALLAAFLYILPMESPYSANSYGSYFPIFIYLSANILFPLMALFVWLRPEEHINYLDLYIAGKVIGTVLFIVWEIFSSSGRAARNFQDMESMIKGMILLGGSVFLSLADTLSIWGAWTMKTKAANSGGAASNVGGITSTSGGVTSDKGGA